MATITASKFRSMVPNAEKILEAYLSSHPDLRNEWERDRKLRNDPRITWIGRFREKLVLMSFLNCGMSYAAK